ncbi:MAG: aminotransferase class I/II-fold pyridoxal phosphate-dependent enzyme, partial [Candidatus Heimdallarchaeota archaeon]
VISQFLGTLMLEEQVYVKNWFRENLKELNMVKNFIFSEIKISPYLEINKNSLTGLGGFYIFLKLIHPSLKDSDEFSKKLIIAEGVILLPGHYFGINWKNYVRISFGNVTMDDAKEGFSRINQFLTDFKK